MESVTKEFSVVVSKKAALVAELERLAKRAKRLGAPAITWAFGEVENKKIGVGEGLTRLVPFVKLTLTGARPKVNGWEFAASVQHLDGVNILRNTPAFESKELPEVYRTRGPVCDHCETKRNRRDTYLLVSEAGEWKEVGSSCLVDFLGHADPHKLAEYAELLASALALCEGGEEDEDGGWGFGGSGPRVYALVEYLAHVAAEIRESGWTPKSAVPERPSASTASMAEDRMAPTRESREHNKRDRSVSESDRKIAEASYEWALALDSTGERMNDYLWNLFAVAKSGIAESRTFGLAASMVAAYTKAEVRKREKAARKPSEYVGTVGEIRSFELLLDKHFSFETAWGWVNRYIFRDENDNVVTWKASGDASVIGATGDKEMVEGTKYILTGTVKEHSDYKGTKQTVLTRCAVRPMDETVLATLRDEENRKAFAKKVKAGTATAEEVAELARLNANRKAALKKTAAKVAAFKTFETTLRGTEGVDAGHGITVRYTDYYATPFFTVSVTATNERRNFEGKSALDNARKFVSEKLAEVASEDSEAA